MSAARKIEPTPVARPAAFVAEMVRAILNGRKTNTRRVVDMSRIEPAVLDWITRAHWEDDPVEFGAHVEFRGEHETHPHFVRRVRSPWRPGDLIWVREGWRTGVALDHLNATQIAERCRDGGWAQPWAPLIYCDGATYDADTLSSFGGAWGRHRSARFMPRWASRITLRVTDVRVERLQDISEADAVAEGCTARTYRDGRGHEPATVDFRCLWEAINGKRAPWASNPWVWRVAFEVVR